MAEFYDGPHATPPPASEGPIYLGIKNMTEDGHLDLSEIRHISESDYPTWTRRVEPRAGDLIFTYEASLHRYAIVPEGFRGTLGRRVALLRPRKNVVDTRFLLYLFISPQWRNVVERRTNVGSTVDRLPLVDFPRFPLRIPALPTQRRIAEILSAYDDLIDNNNCRIKRLAELAQRIYREWFVDFRYPGHETMPLVDSELGLIPDGWKVRRLEEVANVTRGLSWDREQEVESGGHPVITIPNVQERLQFRGMTELTGVSPSNVERFTLAHGDTVLVGSNGNPERVGHAVWIPHGTKVLVASFLMRVRADPSRLGPAILHMQLKDPRLTSAWRSSAIGSTSLRNIRLTTLRASSVLLPAAEVRSRGEAELQDVLDLQDALDRESAVLRATRDHLLPRLFSGEIDLKSLDAGADA